MVLMIIGMCVVFLFLVLLVAAMTISGRMCRALARWFPEPEPSTTLGKLVDDHADIAVAIAAVRAHTRT